jgi:outer membrane autotransporter protein
VYDPAPNAVPGGEAVDRTATADPDGWQFTVNAGAGYDFRLGATTLTPYGRVEYLNLHIDGYTEQGASGLDLKVRSQNAESLLTVLGGRIAHAFSTPFAVLAPHFRAEWRHEYLNNERSITAQFVNDPLNTLFTIPTDNPDRDYFAIGSGIAATFGKGVAAFFDFETILGLRDVTSHNFTAGVRLEF